MATYIARHANPRAGMRFTRETPQPRELDEDKRAPFGARGRTIYNAEAYPTKPVEGEGKCGALRELARIDAEEDRRRRHGDQFLMAARGDFEGSSSSGTVSGAAAAADSEELFALYIAM